MAAIPLNEKPYYSTDQIANSIAADDMFDCYLEPVPGVGFVTRRRPGLTIFADLGSGLPGQGLFWWDAAHTLVAVSGGRIYRVNGQGAVTDITGATLDPTRPVTFADGQDLAGTPWLYLANGTMVSTTGGATTAPSDANAPAADHVGWLNSRFLANQPGTNRFFFTDTNPDTGLMDNGYWSATDNPLTCEARGDHLGALFTAWQEIHAWGTQGLEIWQDDGVTPFTPIAGAFSETGLEAPQSVVLADNTVFALCCIGGSRVVVKMQGRSPVAVSAPISRILADMPTVADAIGDLISVGGISLYLLSFPTAGQTWAYDYVNDTWCRWGFFVSGQHHQFLGVHAAYAKGWGKQLIQSRQDSTIYELRRDAYDDAGNIMQTIRRTAWLNHDTYNRKRCDQFYVKVKCGQTNSATLLLRFRDDGRAEWSNYIEVPLRPLGNGQFLAKMNRFGQYRSRQYEFTLSDAADLVLVGADVELTGMSS